MKKILIVDDMFVSLQMTENMLAGQYETFCASSPEEAMEIYRKEQPDLMIVDYAMPNMTGVELMKILQEEAGKEIPFIIMKADGNVESETSIFDSGARDFIRKPFNPKILLWRVANVFRAVG